MQEGYEDYYQTTEYGNESGCCLICATAHPGCLCFECKCKSCFWYSDNGYGGSCDKVEELKEERRKIAKKNYEKRAEEEFEKSNLLVKENKTKEEEIRKKGKIPNYYSCQKCQRLFCIEEERIIIPFKKPLCKFCEDKNGL